MRAFTYLTNDVTGYDKFRHLLAFEKSNGRQSHVGTFTIPSGFTGSRAVTGVGFKPDALFVMGTGMSALGFTDYGILHLGFTDGVNRWAGGVALNTLADGRWGVWKSDKVICSPTLGTIDMEADLTSFDTDGFTLNVTTGPSVNNLLPFLALKGGGSYACGTAQVPVATGTQAITGLGFKPTAIFVASAMRDALSMSGSSWARPSFGAGDANGQYCVWSGSTAGDVYVNELATSKILTMAIDAQLAGPFDPAVTDEASLLSLDADGFTLDWTTTSGTQWYWSWFALDGVAEVARFIFNHTANHEKGAVFLNRCPKAMLFFMNDQSNESQSEADTNGAGNSLGIVDDSGHEFLASYGDESQPDFFVPISGRSLIAEGFGAYQKFIASPGTFPNLPVDRGTVTIRCRRDHLLRMHVGQ